MEFRNIEDLKADEKEINVKVKLVNVDKRSAHTERGENVYYYGLIGDETGTMFFTAWSFNPNVQNGDVLELKNCYTKEFNGTVRLYVDNKSEIILRPGETMEVKRSFKEAKIRDLTPKDSYVSLKGVITEVGSKEYEKDGEKRTLFYGNLGDETGKIRISSFGKELPEGKGIMIEGARISEYKGRLRVSVNEKTKIEDTAMQIPSGRRFYNSSDLETPVGGITFTGFIITLGEKSGLRLRCSECRKTIEDVRCPDHPGSPFVFDLFAYFTLSDGTGYQQCTAGKKPLMKLLGLQETDLEPDKSNLTKRDVYNRLRDKLHGRPYLVEGDLAEGNNGLTLRVNDLSGVTSEDLKSLIRIMEAEL